MGFLAAYALVCGVAVALCLAVAVVVLLAKGIRAFVRMLERLRDSS